MDGLFMTQAYVFVEILCKEISENSKENEKYRACFTEIFCSFQHEFVWGTFAELKLFDVTFLDGYFCHEFTHDTFREVHTK